ncbi:hypothetical protein AAHC03_01768 [Spirometra sp. Aus1]
MIWTLQPSKLFWQVNGPPARLFMGLLLCLALGSDLFRVNVEAIRWLSIFNLRKSSDYPPESPAPPFSAKECQIARNHLGFRPRQYKFCTDPKLGYAMLPVLRAARAVGYHCPEAFSDRRWNCSSVTRLPWVSPELKLGTREQAVVHAYAAAALIFEIGRYCAMNKIRFCSCGSDGATQITPGGDANQMSRFPGMNPPLNRRTKRQIGSHKPYPFPGIADALSYQGGNAANQNQAQTTFYHSGCPDNVETARSYVAQFLGFDEQRLLVLGHPEMRQPPMLPPAYGFYEQPQTGLGGAGLTRRQRSVRESASNEDEEDEEINHERLRRGSKGKRNTPLVRLSNQHNYMAGAWMMIALQKHSCKCHGVSGSCAQKVCFRQLQRIDTPAIKTAIRQRYLTAQKVSRVAQGRLLASIFRETEFVDEFVELDNLVFTEHSPDYCLPDPQRGSVGTVGRYCDLNVTGDGSCMNMCCGRGYRSITKQIFEKCRCVMQQNFKVHCQTCVREETRHVCL